NQEYALWITTSMGQAATTAKPLETQLYVKDLAAFMKVLGLENDEWKRMPAMLPQVNVQVSETKAAEFHETLQSLRIDGGTGGFRAAAHGFFSIDLGHENIYNHPQVGQVRGKTMTYEQMSLENVEIQDKSGTSAYHIPQGCLLIYDPAKPHSVRPSQRSTVST